MQESRTIVVWSVWRWSNYVELSHFGIDFVYKIQRTVRAGTFARYQVVVSEIKYSHSYGILVTCIFLQTKMQLLKILFRFRVFIQSVLELSF